MVIPPQELPRFAGRPCHHPHEWRQEKLVQQHAATRLLRLPACRLKFLLVRRPVGLAPPGQAGHHAGASGLTVWLLACSILSAADIDPDPCIRNPLRQAWPWDLVSVDCPPIFGALRRSAVFADGLTRPIQACPEAPGQVLFVATVLGRQVERDGRKVDEPPPALLPVAFLPTETPSRLKISRQTDHLLIGNGVCELRLRTYEHERSFPSPLDQVRHWLGGIRTTNAPWDGRAWFLGNSEVLAARTEVLVQGPVYCEVRISYEFRDAAEPGTMPVLPLAAGKQCHRWPLGQPPYEQIERRNRLYQVLIRVVEGDPWIEVVERMVLPSGHGYRIHFGRPDKDAKASTLWSETSCLPLDTVFWPRWFEYDRFGGNDRLLVFPAVSRPEQKGRPFANLTPRWVQAGACSQDIWFTSDGPADRPCLGVVAIRASAWVNPLNQIIRAQVDDRERAWCEFPLAGPGSTGLGAGSRAWALFCGQRGQSDDINKVNDLIRRHADWTLNAVSGTYALAWNRDPALAGPHLLIGRNRMEALRRCWRDSDPNPTRLLLLQAQAERERWQQELATAATPDSKARRKELTDRLGHQAWAVLDLIQGKVLPPSHPPGAGLFLSRRFQDDFFNPTQHTVRSLVKSLVNADLTCGGEPLGDGWTAALGYYFSDRDQWPGWLNGWHPGNPNFHTDKYRTIIAVAGTLTDHPHASRWLDYGLAQFQGDLDQAISSPDGVGYECPGYSGYSLNHHLELAWMLANLGKGELVAHDPRFRATAIWHRKLLTPFDPRLGQRHEAPIGDTHRWDAGLVQGFTTMAAFFATSDPAFARELLAATRLSAGPTPVSLETRLEQSYRLDPALTAADPATLDWSSQTFRGFGAILRHRFGTPRESFLSFKAGPAHGHYHNDESSFHWYGEGAPLLLDYNCSYHPRGDHAALHNTVTFGQSGLLTHHASDRQVEGLEQPFGPAEIRAFATHPLADALISERRADSLTLSPWNPEQAEFGRRYPSRPTPGLLHRRLLMLVKHPADSPWADYLVVRDETAGNEPAQINLHCLARDLTTTGSTAHFVGQWNVDVHLAVFAETAPRFERLAWYYNADELGPAPPPRQADETGETWTQRARTAWQQQLAASQGRCLIPPATHAGSWLHGEYQIWLRLHLPPATPAIWVLYPLRSGAILPRITALGQTAIRLELQGTTETVHLTSRPPPGLPGQAVIERDGNSILLLRL